MSVQKQMATNIIIDNLFGQILCEIMENFNRQINIHVDVCGHRTPVAAIESKQKPYPGKELEGLFFFF